MWCDVGTWGVGEESLKVWSPNKKWTKTEIGLGHWCTCRWVNRIWRILMMYHLKRACWKGKWRVWCAPTIRWMASPRVLTQISFATLFVANGASMGESNIVIFTFTCCFWFYFLCSIKISFLSLWFSIFFLFLSIIFYF